MATSLPSYTETMDDYFIDTWYEVKAKAIDNILDANVITAALKRMGCFETQVGGKYMEETIRYGEVEKQNIKKGDTLEHGEPELETVALWSWKYTLAPVQRTVIDDQVNSGPHKRKDYVAKRIGAARDGLNTGFENDLMAVIDTDGGYDLRGDRDPNSIPNILALPSATYQTGLYTYGGILRANAWWQFVANAATDPAEVNLVSDMKTLYNDIGENKEPPKLIISSQATFELYEEFGVSKTQLIKDATTELVDLGYEVMRYKGKPMIWTALMAANTMYMLNTDYIKLKYDPNLWFDMTGWKDTPNQLERIAYIICAYNLICNQMRRQGALTSISV